MRAFGAAAQNVLLDIHIDRLRFTPGRSTASTNSMAIKARGPGIPAAEMLARHDFLTARVGGCGSPARLADRDPAIGPPSSLYGSGLPPGNGQHGQRERLGSISAGPGVLDLHGHGIVRGKVADPDLLGSAGSNCAGAMVGVLRGYGDA